MRIFGGQIFVIGVFLVGAQMHAWGEHREFGAHVHGTTTMNVAIDGQSLVIEFEMPGVNAVGFEHPPHSDAERAQLKSALALLQAPADWLMPNPQARCSLKNANAAPNGFDAAPPQQNEHEHEHADIDVSYLFECQAPLDLRTIELHLIERFPGTHEIHVNITSPNGQAQEVFSTPVATITFAPAAQ